MAHGGSLLVLLLGGLLLGSCRGALPHESLGSETDDAVPTWAKRQGFQDNKTAVAGAHIFAKAGCVTCHTYLGEGSSNLGAPDLSAEGAKHKGIRFQIEHLKCPSCVNPGSPMPSFKDLGDKYLRQLAVFLEASKGPR